ncbi:hypothetical protein SOVF_146300, partial [Spinacia oleracea]
KREKTVISKKDMKMALVAKRISMLQDDHEDEVHPVLCLENPVQCESTKLLKDISDDTDTLSEDVVLSNLSKNRTQVGSHKRARVVSDDESSEDKELVVWAPLQKKGSQRMDPLCDKPSSMKRAEEVQANLPAEYPSFVKLMLKSHVSGGFWLGLPKKFCDQHLPICDSIVVLVDEAGNESRTKYLVAKAGLSGGWKGFSVAHDLLPGDTLVFQLITPTKFKIYIVREQTFCEVDGALGLLTLDAGAGHQKSEVSNQKFLQTEDDYIFTEDLSRSNSDGELGSEVLDGICFSDSDIKFEQVKGFEDFHIVVDGLIIDSKFTANTRKKYYELCQSQSSFLHENFLKGLNCNLVVGVISETINIADAIKSCKRGSSISHEDLQTWEKTLKGSEFLGMKVDFLRVCINQLLGIAVESSTTNESNKLKERITRRALAGERMKKLEVKLTQLKQTMEKIDLEMDDEIKMANAWKQEGSIIMEIPAV